MTDLKTGFDRYVDEMMRDNPEAVAAYVTERARIDCIDGAVRIARAIEMTDEQRAELVRWTGEEKILTGDDLARMAKALGVRAPSDAVPKSARDADEQMRVYEVLLDRDDVQTLQALGRTVGDAVSKYAAVLRGVKSEEAMDAEGMDRAIEEEIERRRRGEKSDALPYSYRWLLARMTDEELEWEHKQTAREREYYASLERCDAPDSEVPEPLYHAPEPDPNHHCEHCEPTHASLVDEADCQVSGFKWFEE